MPEAPTDGPFQGIKLLEDKMWSEWSEVCNAKKSCPDDLDCASYWYADLDSIFGQPSTGYVCTPKSSLCSYESLEQLTLATNDSYPILSWEC